MTYDACETVITYCLQRYRQLFHRVGLDESDVRQDLWVRLLTRPDSCQSPALLYTVARATVVDTLRAHWGRPGRNHRRRVALLRAQPLPLPWGVEGGGYDYEPSTPPADLPDDVWGHRRRVLNNGLNRLLPRDWQVIEACFVHNRPATEIACELGCTVGRVHQRKQRALRVLRGVL